MRSAPAEFLQRCIECSHFLKLFEEDRDEFLEATLGLFQSITRR